jgi:hypothetical protein
MIPAATTMLMMPDTRFGAYELQALIGCGGMSEVYVRVVLGWDHDVTRLGQENRAGQ